MTATQFLGAFNDNVFKMLLLLICTDFVQSRSSGSAHPYFDPYQTVASLLFALSFVLISSFAGYLSDRYPKKHVVVACKFGEIVVMTAGLIVFLTGSPGSFSLIIALFAVLFLMGSQSAFFGPSKYGILPELFSKSDLPMVNGIILATTFLAIIFGTALGGFLKDALGQNMWPISFLCVVLAAIGTFTAMLIRPTPPAVSKLPFTTRNLFIDPNVWRTVLQDRLLIKVLMVYSVFWFFGGVTALVITLIGQIQMNLTATTTALFNAAIGLGIGIGSVWAAKRSTRDTRLSLVSKGSLGLFMAISAASIIAVTPMDVDLKPWIFGLALLIGGFFGGWIAVPLQVFVQVHPPGVLKGRVIAVMNMMTWVGILLASVYYFATLALTGFRMDPSWILLSVGFIMLLAGVGSRLEIHKHALGERRPEPDSEPASARTTGDG